MKDVLLKQLEVTDKKMTILLSLSFTLTKEEIIDRLKILKIELKTLKQDIQRIKESNDVSK
tara:strand:- start:4620 stop:4802 length:183 start_codon:yes stop_codon:yes gene_type:complete